MKCTTFKTTPSSKPSLATSSKTTLSTKDNGSMERNVDVGDTLTAISMSETGPKEN